MNCIVVDDEPLAREAVKLLIGKTEGLLCVAEFNNAEAAEKYLAEHQVPLVFLDIQMPGIDGITFARSIPVDTHVIFTTAYSQYALDSYEIDALDYLLKPIKPERFQKAVDKAFTYQKLFDAKNEIVDVNSIDSEYCFIKADRRVFKVAFKDVLFIEGLKDYVILHTIDQKIITAMNIKTIHHQLPTNIFIRTSKSYLINKQKITSFDNNTVYIEQHEIPIGNAYRALFFDDFANKKMLSR
jgi:DNA-binding LytR/AlgR family response regulator